MQKEFDKFKIECNVIIADILNLMNLVAESSIDRLVKVSSVNSLQNKITAINDHVFTLDNFYNNRKSEYAQIIKTGHLNTYVANQKDTFSKLKYIIEKRIENATKDVVIADNDDAPIGVSGIERYYSETIDRKLNNNGISGAFATHLVDHSSHARLTSHASELTKQTKSKDTVIDVDKIGRGLTTPMIAIHEFNSHLYKADTIRKHYYAKSKPKSPSEVVIENLPTNGGKANTKDIVL